MQKRVIDIACSAVLLTAHNLLLLVCGGFAGDANSLHPVSVQAMVADPLREALPQHAARLHTPARLPPILNISVRQAAAKLFTVRRAVCTAAQACACGRRRDRSPLTALLDCAVRDCASISLACYVPNRHARLDTTCRTWACGTTPASMAGCCCRCRRPAWTCGRRAARRRPRQPRPASCRRRSSCRTSLRRYARRLLTGADDSPLGMCGAWGPGTGVWQRSAVCSSIAADTTGSTGLDTDY